MLKAKQNTQAIGTTLFAILLWVFMAQASASILANSTSPLLNEAFCDGTPESLGFTPDPDGRGGNPGNGEVKPYNGSGRPMYRVSLGTYPEAICNDGSPAVMYVRPAPLTKPDGMPNSLVDSWQIHFKGGGSCRSFESCRKRWCGEESSFLNQPGLMSSLGTPARTNGTGLLSSHSDNLFSLTNQVLMFYCSSDTWVGNQDAGEAESIDLDDSASHVSRIAFKGQKIVEAVFDELDKGVTVTNAQGQNLSTGKLSDAENILISGDSGGASGARQHLDSLAGRYASAKLVGAVDAGGAVDLSDPRVDWQVKTATPSYASYVQARLDQARTFHGLENTALDASCIASVNSTDYQCVDSYHVQKNHISTDLLQRTSYSDVTNAKSSVSTPEKPSLIESPQVLRQLSYDGLAAAYATNSKLSVLGANCDQHVTYRTNLQYRNMRIEALKNDGSLGSTLQEDMEDWVSTCWQGSCTKQSKLAAPQMAESSFCPGESIHDEDADGVFNDMDNCPYEANSGQEDADNDQIGDICDATPTGDSMCFPLNTSNGKAVVVCL